ncbi:hypothetical protein [uncultured Paracoccus sp.]|uniref:hypothetical protein n=1 Tax=uncultured Paracoccus sp. TaxID=189685 RepID=UPI00261631F4|nr:hypothetical protein [uncultured Paracoccus sp.]
MTGLILTTFDWVPDGPRGFVREVRLRPAAFCSDPFGHGFCVIAASPDKAQSGE